MSAKIYFFDNVLILSNIILRRKQRKIKEKIKKKRFLTGKRGGIGKKIKAYALFNIFSSGFGIE